MVGARVLILDDEETLVFLMTRMLEHLGHKPAGFTQAADALATFAAAPDKFDVVITDVSMPGPGGLEVARQILATKPNATVVLATGSIKPADAEQARALGVRYIVEKPASIEEMEQLMKRVLDPH